MCKHLTKLSAVLESKAEHVVPEVYVHTYFLQCSDQLVIVVSVAILVIQS